MVEFAAWMADERVVVMTVECRHCKAKQAVHVAARTGFVQMGDQTIACSQFQKDFHVMIPDRIIAGPFTA